MSSLGVEKIPKSCKICEKGDPVAWKCLDCSTELCHGCKAIHERFAVTQNHITVPLGTLSKEVLDGHKIRLFSLLKVKEQGVCDIYCKNCKIRIKSADTLMEHMTHSLENSAEHILDVDTEVKLLIAKIEDEMRSPVSFETKRQLADERKAMKREVQLRYEQVVRSCKDKMKGLNEDIEKFYKEKEKRVREAKSRVDKESTKLAKAKEKLAMARNKNDPAKLETAFHDTKQQMARYSSVLPIDEKVVFQIGERSSVEVGDEIGSLSYTLSATVKATKFHLDLIGKYGTTKLQIVSVLAPCGENEVCIGGVKLKAIQLVSLVRPSSPINEFSMTFYDFCSTIDGNFLFITDFKDKSLKSLSKTGSLCTIRDFKTLYPTCVHITSKNQIFIGVVDTDNHNLDADSRRAILQVTTKGETKADFEFDPRGIRLFTVPYRCHLNEVNNFLVVIDKYDPATGRIVAVNSTGDVKFRYSGFADNSKFKSFRPTDVCCTKSGETVISDIDNHSLHILDKTGIFIQNLSTLELHISHPHSLAIDGDDKLWIGTGPPSTSKEKGHIYSTRILKY